MKGFGAKLKLKVVCRTLIESDMDAIAGFLEKIVRTLSDPDSFLPPTHEILKKCLISKLSIVAFCESEMVGCRLSYVPRLDKDNLGYFFELSDSELEQLVQYHGVAVSQEFRGLGLAKDMHKRALKVIADSGYKYITATCHPENKPSLYLLKKFGFRHNSEIHNFLGKERYFLLHSI